MSMEFRPIPQPQWFNTPHDCPIAHRSPQGDTSSLRQNTPIANISHNTFPQDNPIVRSKANLTPESSSKFNAFTIPEHFDLPKTFPRGSTQGNVIHFFEQADILDMLFQQDKSFDSVKEGRLSKLQQWTRQWFGGKTSQD